MMTVNAAIIISSTYGEPVQVIHLSILMSGDWKDIELIFQFCGNIINGE